MRISDWSSDVCSSDLLGAVPVLLVALAGLQAAEHAELALEGDADLVGHVGDAAGDLDVVGIVRRRLGVRLPRAVHHHAGEAVLNRGQAGRLRVYVCLVAVDGNSRSGGPGGYDPPRP